MNTLLLRNLLACLHRYPLVNIDTGLSWNFFAHLERFLCTFLLWNLMADLFRMINTDLSWDIIAHREAELTLLGLAHISTLLVWFLSACARDGDPDLVIPLPLPPVVTLLTVQGLAHCLNVGLHLSLHLVNTHLVMLSMALGLQHSVTPGHRAVHTQHIGLRHTHLLILCVTLLGLYLFVICEPCCGVLYDNPCFVADLSSGMNIYSPRLQRTEGGGAMMVDDGPITGTAATVAGTGVNSWTGMDTVRVDKVRNVTKCCIINV